MREGEIMADMESSTSHQERMEAIFQILSKQGIVRVAELQKLLNVSDMTVRRCLNVMAADGLIKRVHGGAATIDGGQSRFMKMRHSLNTNVKALLAKRALDFMEENSSIFLDSGTTCFSIARALTTSGKKLNVITDSIKVLRELQGVRHLNTMILGGALSDDMTTIDGAFTADAASRLTIDTHFFSADGFTLDELEQKYLTGMMTKKIVISRSNLNICLCDSSKYNKRCCFKFCEWNELDVFISDVFLPAEVKRGIQDKGIEVHVVSDSNGS